MSDSGYRHPWQRGDLLQSDRQMPRGYGDWTPFNTVPAPRNERIGECTGCGHQYTTIAEIYECEYCGRKA
jgi:hypothetical protein